MLNDHIIQITEEEVTQLQTLNMIIPTPNKNPITSCYDNNNDEYIPYKSTLDNVILKHIQHPYFNMIANYSGNEWEKHMYTFHNANVSYHVWDSINKQGTRHDEKQNKLYGKF